MAVITDIETERYTYRQQYCRVDMVRAKKNEMVVGMGVYDSQEASVNGGLPHRVEEFLADFDLASSLNAWQQAYAAIKQRWPESTDV